MVYFVLNPEAGNGKALKVWTRLDKELAKRGVGYDFIRTRAAGEARDWCRRAAAERLAEDLHASVTHDVLKIIVVGGDGTLNEAVQGLMEAAHGQPTGDGIRLGFIAAGSGNDFARGHGIPLQPEDALAQLLDAINDDRREPVDVLEVNGRYAASSIGAGLDGEVAYLANTAPYKRWMNRVRLGFAAYILSLLRVLAGYRPCDADLVVDGKTYPLRRVWLAAVSNIPYYGGGMMINPEAKPNDGIAHVCVVSGFSRSGLLKTFPKVYSGRHIGHPNVSFYHGREVEILPRGLMRLHADGEEAGLTPARIRVIQHAFHVIK